MKAGEALKACEEALRSNVPVAEAWVVAVDALREKAEREAKEQRGVTLDRLEQICRDAEARINRGFVCTSASSDWRVLSVAADTLLRLRADGPGHIASLRSFGMHGTAEWLLTLGVEPKP